MQIADITQFLETLAPPALKEDYDNVGLLYGGPEVECTGAYLVLDCLPERIEEAVALGCNLVIAHHPLIFKGIKRIDPSHWAGRALELAVRHNVAIYAIHTNLDNVLPGVNSMLAERIGLDAGKLKPLKPLKNALVGLTTFVLKEHADAVLQTLWAAGAGQIGQYKNCAYQLEGTGTFTPQPGAHPAIGQTDRQEQVGETRLELILPMHKEPAVLKALFAAHSYEEVAYYLYPLRNTWQEAGAGAIGELETALPFDAFCRQVCRGLDIAYLRHTGAGADKLVKKVALCGGAGSFLIDDAIRTGADVLVTGDVKPTSFWRPPPP